jgi:hypothetical protein
LQIDLRSPLGEPVSVTLSETVDDITGFVEWSSPAGGEHVAISLNERREIVAIVTGDQIASSQEEISDKIIEILADIARLQAAGIEYSEPELSSEEDSGPFPYNPESIRVDTKPFNISLVYDMIKDGDINLSPDFQRQFVWTDVGARSRLIESIMLRIPLPVFYMAQDAEGRLHVVDGLQRLTVISQFLDGNLKLRELEYLKEEQGKIFRHDDPSKCIDQRYRKRIMQTQILFNIIDPQTPSDVKFDIFKRINQGGRPLNAQEIRNCMSSPTTRSLITSLCNSEEFVTATSGSVGVVRMQDQELVLRFLAFKMAEADVIGPYQGNMERFLDGATDQLNKSDQQMMKKLKSEFLSSMKNCYHLFGEFAFRKCLVADLEPGSRRRLINNSLFTTWSLVLSGYAVEAVARLPACHMATVQAHRLEADDELLDSVTSGTNDRRRLAYTFAAAREMSRELLR